MQLSRKTRRTRQEDGYVLLAILFALTVLIIALAAAAPKAATALQRAKEDELIHRGEQYQLAIRRFYRKFGRYPASIDQLENTNTIRFLRRRYLDPVTGKDDWKPIQYGQARPSLGFFGQKVTTVGGVNPAGAGLGPSTLGTPTGGSDSSNASAANGTTTDNSTASAAQSGNAPTANSGSATGANATSPSGSASNPFTPDQLTGRTFGGGAIVGFSVPVQKEALKVFEQKTHYNEWQFVYDPTMDPSLRGGIPAGVAGGIVGGTLGGTPGSASGLGSPMQGPANINPGMNNTTATPQSPAPQTPENPQQ